MLEHFEKQFSTQLISRFFGLIFVARRGLSEDELLDLLGSGTNKLPMTEWIPLIHASSRYLSSRGTRLTFSSPTIRSAIWQRYFQKNLKTKLNFHRILATYFESQLQTFSNSNLSSSNMSRVAEELPYHLHILNATQRLIRCLSSWPLFEVMYTEDGKFELQKYWHLTEKSDEAHKFFARFMDSNYRSLEPSELAMRFYK